MINEIWSAQSAAPSQFYQGKIFYKLLFSAIDPKAAVTGGLLFASWLVIGNFVNSFMEEGLFRGVMLNLNRIKLSLWRSNWLQAGLFGAWHLVWVVKWYQTGAVSTPGEISLGVVANFLPRSVSGWYGVMLI